MAKVLPPDAGAWVQCSPYSLHTGADLKQTLGVKWLWVFNDGEGASYDYEYEIIRTPEDGLYALHLTAFTEAAHAITNQSLEPSAFTVSEDVETGEADIELRLSCGLCFLMKVASIEAAHSLQQTLTRVTFSRGIHFSHRIQAFLGFYNGPARPRFATG